jgi:hypothetical protein
MNPLRRKWHKVFVAERKVIVEGPQRGHTKTEPEESFPHLDLNRASPITTDDEREDLHISEIPTQITEEGEPNGVSSASTDEAKQVTSEPKGNTAPPKLEPDSREEEQKESFVVDRSGKPGPVLVSPDVDIKGCQLALAAVRHSYWFQDKSIPSNVVSCIRLIKDFRRRNPEWQPLNPWVRLIVEIQSSRFRHSRYW